MLMVILYHGTPIENLEVILSQGILPYGCDAYTYFQPAVWLTTSPQLALFNAYEMEKEASKKLIRTPSKAYAILYVDVSNLEYERVNWRKNDFITFEKIGPENIKRFQTESVDTAIMIHPNF